MRFTTPLVVLALILIVSINTTAQVGIGTTTPSANAVLELKSPDNNQGFLVPRMTTAQRTATAFTSALTSVEAGLLVFDTNTGKFYYWSGTAWVVIEDSTGTDSQTLGFAAGNLSISGGNSVLITGTAPGGSAAGDLTGNYPNPTIANNAVTNAKIASGVAVTKLSPGTNGQVLTTTAGSAAWGTLDLSLTSNTLSLTGDASTVSLAPYLDNTDAQNLTFTSPNLSISGGNSVNLSAINTDAQTLSFASPNLTISGGNSINISGINTDNQDLTLTGNILSLTNDASTINLAPYLDNTDAQNLSLGTRTGTQQPVNISGGTGITIDVADNDNSVTNEIQNLALGTRTGTQQPVNISGGTGITIDVADNDNSATNEIQNLALGTRTGTQQPVNISGGTGITIDVADNDNSATNEIQNLSLGTRTGTQQPINISGGTGATIDVADNDNNSTNEIQSLSIAGNALTISGGNTVTLPSGGGGGVTGEGEEGQVAFWKDKSAIAGNSNLFWNDKDNLLGIGLTPKTNLHVGGSHAATFTIVAGDYTVNNKDYILILSNSANSVTLPDAASIIGRILIIRSVASKPVTVKADKDTIDGLGQITLTNEAGQVNAVTLIAIQDGIWLTLNQSRR